MTRTRPWICRCWHWHEPGVEKCSRCGDETYWWLNHNERKRREFLLAKGVAWRYAHP